MLSRIGGSVAGWLFSEPSFAERFVAALLFWGLPGILLEYFVWGRWSGLLDPLLESAVIAVLLPFIVGRIKNAKSQSARNSK